MILLRVLTVFSLKLPKILLVKKTIFVNSRLKQNQPWFTNSCREKRKAFHKAKKNYNLNKSDANKRNLQTAYKSYKAEMNSSYQNYQFKMENELRKKSNSDPRELWKILNNFSNSNSREDPKLTIDTLYEYFKNLNSTDDTDDSDVEFDIPNLDDDLANDILNSKITEDEIISAIRGLKNGKAPGYDDVLNEYIKSTFHLLMPLYVLLFNKILDTGIIPEIWTAGIIMAIYKNKGDPSSPDSYRGITLVSSMGKLFTSILNDRLTKYADLVNIIPEAQAGFRKGYSTVDNIFCLHVLIEIYLAMGKKLYCTFVDFRKAFDTVWRVGLWQKLVKNNVSGKILKVIYNMYDNIKSCVRQRDQISGFFSCETGVRQGENLSPFLFSIFLSDLEKYFIDNNINGLRNITNQMNDELRMYVLVFVLLYADDTIILAESAKDLQDTLNAFENYCNQWKLSVNVDKTKSIIFSKRKCRTNHEFRLCGEIVEIVDKFSYLGIIFNYNGKFTLAKKKLSEQAQKALFALYGKIRNICIPIDLQLKLFESLVEPILLYACEIWGFENSPILEKIHLRFLKNILSIRSTTPNYMVYGETGRTPLDIKVKTRMLNFWSKILCNPDKLSGKLYQLFLQLHSTGLCNSGWITNIKSILDNTGYSFVWNSQSMLTKADIKSHVKPILLDQFIQKWYSDMEKSSRGQFYSKLKTNFGMEKYLTVLKKNRRIYITKVRCSNVKFPIETGRWNNVPQNERVCTFCNSRSIGNEAHYLFYCRNEQIQQLQEKYIPKYYRKSCRDDKIIGMLSYCNLPVLNNLAIFIQKLSSILR